jgi:hypothetical protein
MFELLTGRGVMAAALIAPPSVELLSALDGIDVSTLDPGLQVDLMVAWERIAAWVAARQLPVIAVVGEVALASATKAMKGLSYSMDMPFRASHAEIGCALRLTERGGQLRLEMAQVIAIDLPSVHTALLAGDISYRHAVAIAETAQEIDDAADRQWVTSKVLPKARHQTVPELRRCLRRAHLAVDPKTSKQRHAKAKSERKLEWFALPDGMAELHLISTAADVKAAFNAADSYAKTMPKKDTDGLRIPLDARRADAVIALLTGTATGSGAGAPQAAALGRPAASVQVTMDLATLLGLRDNPGELAGYGPIPASAARALAADGKWRRLIHDPLTGALLDLGKTSYQPSAALERFIRSRDARCAFPSCGQPAHRCHVDHTCPYRSGPAGKTTRSNLGALCENHHILKHKTDWILRRDQTTHEATWTSPTHHEYPVTHHDHRAAQAKTDADADADADTVGHPGLFDHIEIRWTDWNYLMSHQDDGQSDWNSFIQDHMCPPEPVDLEPEYEPHETYNFGGDDEREPLTRTLDTNPWRGGLVSDRSASCGCGCGCPL